MEKIGEWNYRDNLNECLRQALHTYQELVRKNSKEKIRFIEGKIEI